MEKAIEISNISYTYSGGDNDTLAVSDISLDIYDGEFLTILGPNGCGKSTLAKLMNGFLTPDSGKVCIFGLDSAADENIFAIRSKVGMVFQNPDNQMVASIIEDDIAFGCENLGIDPQETRERVDWALRTVGMDGYQLKTPFKLSGGQKQRIAIAAILAMMPKVLILDESTAMLDPEGRKEVLETAHKLNKENGMTIILITHLIDEAILSDRICIMNNGHIVNIGNPTDIFSNPNMLKSNLLDAPIACNISTKLRAAGLQIDTCFTDDKLVEELCQLK